MFTYTVNAKSVHRGSRLELPKMFSFYDKKVKVFLGNIRDLSVIAVHGY